MIVCLTSARFNMKADILKQNAVLEQDPDTGEWTTTQDPDSGEIIRVWSNADDPSTMDDEHVQEDTGMRTFRCEARAIIDGGIRVAGTTERFDALYEGVDYVRITFPANTNISRRDQIANIRDRHGNIIWTEEERLDNAPTVFSVTGVAPVIDPFGKHIESMALLERVETQ